MAFTTDNNRTSDNLPDGEYEVIIKAAFRDVSKTSGKNNLTLRMVVRNDIDWQDGQNRVIFHRLWKRKEPTSADRQCEDFGCTDINRVSKAVGFADKQSFDSIDAWLGELGGKTLRVTVKTENDYFNVKKMEPTQYPICNHKWAADQAAERNVDNENLPF